MFVIVTEIGPTMRNIQVVDSCWNVYESIDVENKKVKETVKRLQEEYQCD